MQPLNCVGGFCKSTYDKLMIHRMANLFSMCELVMILDLD